jgi:hypothetical protein
MKVNFALGVSELLDGVYKLSILHTVFVLVFKLSSELMQIIHQWNTMKICKISYGTFSEIFHGLGVV